MTSTDLASHASRCLEAWTSGDFTSTRTLLADDVTFEGPMGTTTSADDYISGATGVAGHVSGVDVKHAIVDGDDVCLVYDLVAESVGTLPTVGWYHFTDDKIASVRAYFDPRPLTEKRRTSTPKMGLDIPLFAAALQVAERAGTAEATQPTATDALA